MSDYKQGFLDGIRAYAWHKDGRQWVGTTGRTLKDAQENVEKTWNYAPPPNIAQPEARVPFDEWFAVMPHPAMSQEEIAEMRRSYEFAWNAAMANVALPEVERTIPAEDCIFGKCPGCGAEFAVLKPQTRLSQEEK